jgi:peptidyl-prolyl cis-trans isomerase C
MLRSFWIALAPLAFAGTMLAQGTLPPPGRAKVAAVVNGREISEAAVQRALKPIPPENWDKARPEVIGFLVDNALVDIYLELLKITVDPKQIETQLETIKKEMAESKQDYGKFLERLELTEAQFKLEIHNQLRWEKFIAQQGTDEKLKRLFESSPEIFDGSTVKARHILITPETADDKGKAAALRRITQIKGAIDTAVAGAEAKVPPGTSPLDRQKYLNKAIEDTFISAAKEYSTCPTKTDGGALREFPRMGMMVEPFAKAAFTLKPFQISEPVETTYGYHLILVTSRKSGEPMQFDAVKGAVIEVYGAKLRDAVVEKMKADPNTKIEIAK